MKEQTEKQRTLAQNRALHKLFGIISEQLNDAGFDVEKTFNHNLEIPWTPVMVKELLWRPIQIAMLDKTSTTELTTKEIDIVFEPLARFLAKQGFETHFPSIDELMLRDFKPY